MMANKYKLESMMLSELLREIVDVSILKPCAVFGLALDSRAIEPGCVFCRVGGCKWTWNGLCSKGD